MVWAPQDRLQDGRYRIESLLGRGGFGLTYLAWDNRRADWVVIKTLNDDLQGDPGFEKFQQDFLNEALRLARCRHPHIVRVEEVILEAGLWCIVMEYVPGLTLQRYVAKHGIMPEPDALHYIRQVGSALTALHQQDMLHRDVKPANVILREQPSQAVLIDFGLVRDFSQGVIQHHTSFGTDGYAPIEQYDSLRRRGAWIDVYGLAATLYTALTGHIPLCAPARIGGRDLDPPQALNPAITDATQAAILQGMAFYAHDRPESIADWIQLLSDSDFPLLDPARTVLDDPVLSVTAQEKTPGQPYRPSLPPGIAAVSVLGISTTDLSDLEKLLKDSAHKDNTSLSRPANRRKTDFQSEEQEPLDSSDPILLPVSPPQPQPVQAQPIQAQPIQAQTVKLTKVPSQPLETPNRAIPISTVTYPTRSSALASAPSYVNELMQIRDLLKAHHWQQADAYTTALMLQITGRSSFGNFDVDAIKTFPKQELQLIDRMWMAYSQGHFGFGIQFHLWSKAPRDIETWGRMVGWRPSDRWLYYHELNYSLEAPPGHLPVGFLAGTAGGLRSSLLLFDRYLLAKWSVCLQYSPQGSLG